MSFVSSEIDRPNLKPSGNAPALSTLYHVYHPRESRRHFVITPKPDERLDKIFPPTAKSWAKKNSLAAIEEVKVEDCDKPGFFLRQPYLSFHHPPRVFMRGLAKDGAPLCLVHSSLFWRRMKLQLGHRLADDGIVDPRGVVDASYNVNKEARGEADLKGYKVRSWRLWCESGKKYHRQVNEQRRSGLEIDKVWDAAHMNSKPIIDEVVMLDWVSPFSRDTRRYHFRYAGLDFYWKGTGTVKESRCCGMFLRYNHLKLVARVPLTDSSDPQLSKTANKRKNHDSEFGEVCLAKYTSLIGVKKSGTLEVFESAIHRIYQDYITPQNGTTKEVLDDVDGLKQTRLYHLVIATGMCMVIQERQKRETVKKTIELLIAGGEGGGGF